MRTYLVNDIYSSIQGEGCLAGVPMVILRLQGCKVGCPFCDTKQTWYLDSKHKVDGIVNALGENPKYAEVYGYEVAEYVEKNYIGFEWVMITGGEPAQYILDDVIDSLHDSCFKVAIETSGTEIGHLNRGMGTDLDWVCVSPKFGMPGGRRVMTTAIAVANEFKFVVGKQSDIEFIKEWLNENRSKLRRDVEICVQPVSQSKKATEICVDAVMRNGWRLSLQLHKYIQIR